jgi:hypothetical protein
VMTVAGKNSVELLMRQSSCCDDCLLVALNEVFPKKFYFCKVS